MRAESLGYFLEIARTGSFTRAARNLYISEQGLSKSVKCLEAELGVVLFQRNGKTVSLTDAGHALEPLASEAVDLQQRIRRCVMQFNGEGLAETHRVTLAAMPFVESLFTLLKDELELAHLHEVVIAEADLMTILHDLSVPSSPPIGMIGIPVEELRCLRLDESIRFVPLFSADITVVGTRALISPRKRFLTKAEIAATPVVYYNEPVLNRMVGRLFSEHPLRDVVLHSSNVPVLQDLLFSGKALTFSDTFTDWLQPGRDGLLILPVKDSASVVTGFVYSRNRAVDPLYIDYVERFQRCFQETCKPYLRKHPFAAERARF